MKSILNRLALTLPVVWLVVSLVFLLLHLVPGDPIQLMLGDSATPADITLMRHQYGLDAPLGAQYLGYWRGVLHGDLGQSIKLRAPVASLLATRYPYTIELTLAALVLGLLLSIPAGVLSAVDRAGPKPGTSDNRIFSWLSGSAWPRGSRDRLLGVFSLLGLSVPSFALGPLLMLFFAIQLGWLPVSGAGPTSAVGWNPALALENWPYLILPAVSMGVSLAAVLTRMVRTAMLEELGQDYIRTARAKGLAERSVVYGHALPNALVPVVTVVGLQFGALLAGAIVTETIFSWPGIGRLLVTAISSRDYPLAQGCLLSIGLTYVLVNLLTDVVYRKINPRIRG